MSAVKTCPLDPAEFLSRFRAAAQRLGFREEPFAEVDGVALSAWTRRPLGPRPRIYVSSGVHGDEPAPPEALLGLLEAGEFDERATWFLVPMLNPSGFRANQRENGAGVDLNRDYKTPQSPEVRGHVQWLQAQPRFDLALCLHEDWEATGFYLYELNTTATAGLARELRQAGEQHLPIDPETVIDGRPIDEPGIIRPESDPTLRDQWPEAIYLRCLHTDLCYTFETPSEGSMAKRIATHQSMTRRAIELVVGS